MPKPTPVAPVPEADARFTWSQVEKVDAPKRSPADRVADFFDIYSFLDEKTARQQAMRCIQCPEPACVEGCPVNNRIPEWMGLVAEGRFLEAARVLQATSCLEEIVARLCAHPCEPRCILEDRAEAVAINAVERFLHEYGFSHGLTDIQALPPNGRTAAVMNGGPCGLTCAYDLARNGYAVTIFDHRSRPGGLLADGIPGFRMARGLLERRLELLRRLGVRFRLGVRPGVDPTLQALRSSYDAVFFGAARGQVKPIHLPGAHLRGVHQGLAFLVQHSAPGAAEGAPIEVRGKRVVVLGGGDVAMDCLRTALRAGAKEALCLSRRGVAQLPANRIEFQNAREEGARFEFHVSPLELLGDDSGAVNRIRCVRTRLGEPGPDGRPLPAPVPGTEFELPADVVFAAFGFAPARFPAEGDLRQIPLTPDGLVIVDENLMTVLPGVFAGGTLVRGISAFLEAVTDARKAARCIHRYLDAQRL